MTPRIKYKCKCKKGMAMCCSLPDCKNVDFKKTDEEGWKKAWEGAHGRSVDQLCPYFREHGKHILSAKIFKDDKHGWCIHCGKPMGVDPEDGLKETEEFNEQLGQIFRQSQEELRALERSNDFRIANMEGRAWELKEKHSGGNVSKLLWFILTLLLLTVYIELLNL